MKLADAITHVSFDMWNTLITPNKNFAEARNAYLAAFYGVPYEKAKAAYTHAKKTLDGMAEENGHGCKIEGAYTILHHQMRDQGLISPDNYQLPDIYHVQKLFVEHPPEIPERLIFAIKKNLIDQQVTINISSNTNFIAGTTLRLVIEPIFADAGVSFLFQLYSDELKLSKPHPNFFKEVVKQAPVNSTSRILHIGDNKITDMYGAGAAGMRNILVKDPDHTADVLWHLQQMNA